MFNDWNTWKAMPVAISDVHMNSTSNLVYRWINWNACITCIAAVNSDSLIRGFVGISPWRGSSRIYRPK